MWSVIAAATSAPPSTARLPPSQKSFCTSTTTSARGAESSTSGSLTPLRLRASTLRQVTDSIRDVDDPYALARQAADRLRELTGIERHDVALVLGSGWVPAVDGIVAGRGSQTGTSAAAAAATSAAVDLAVTDLPGFAPPAVLGHAG